MDTSPDVMFDDQLAAAGAAVEVCANMSAFANHLLFKAREFASEADIPNDDPRLRGLRSLIDVWDEKIAPAFALATQKDPTGPRGAEVTRPWRDPTLMRA
jgi:hypothetical protein